MCFCLSGSMIHWWTHSSSLAFSLTALYPVFSGQDTGCFLDFLCIFLLVSSLSSDSINLLPPTLLDLFVLLLGFFFFQPVCRISWVHIYPPFTPVLLLLFLPSYTVPCLLVRGVWAMLSSPTVILQPYGLPVYPQTTTCYPGIVQVNSPSYVVLLQMIKFILVFTTLNH